MKVKALLFILLAGCSSNNSAPVWDYMTPENLKCRFKEEIKICERIGSKIICECYV